MLDPAAFHNLLAFFNVLLFAILNDLPELIREDVNSLVKLILSSLVLSEVRKLITEIIEVLDELFQLFLFGVWTVNKLKILLLDVIKARRHALSLNSHLSEYLLHLILVGLT